MFVGDSCSWSLPLIMKVMISCFVSDTQKVITLLILIMLVLVLQQLTEWWLPSKCCCEVMSAIS